LQSRPKRSLLPHRQACNGEGLCFTTTGKCFSYPVGRTAFLPTFKHDLATFGRHALFLYLAQRGVGGGRGSVAQVAPVPRLGPGFSLSVGESPSSRDSPWLLSSSTEPSRSWGSLGFARPSVRLCRLASLPRLLFGSGAPPGRSLQTSGVPRARLLLVRLGEPVPAGSHMGIRLAAETLVSGKIFRAMQMMRYA